MHIRRHSFSVDLILNYAAFVVSACCGLLFLYICAANLGQEGFGILSQVTALFIVVSQIAVGGLQFSALQTAGDSTLGGCEKQAQIWAAICAAGLWGSCITIIAFIAQDIVGRIFHSPPVGQGWSNAVLALALFAVNKTAASALNGLDRMRLFALQTALRSILLVFFSGVLIIGGAGPVSICWMFICVEAVMSIYLLVQVVATIGFPKGQWMSLHKVKRHVSFGLRALWSGLAYEINLRLDILMVGFFLSDTAVGIYALVAQLAEGFFNILVVLRNQLAPTLARLTSSGDIFGIQQLAYRLLAVVVPISLAIAAVGVALYAPVIEAVLPEGNYGVGSWILAILLVGIVANAWIMPLETILIVSGRPGRYSLMMLCVIATNILMNIVLVPILGLYGAAIATCVATILSGVYLLFFLRQALGFWLIPKTA